jgi:outer membrane protein
MLSRRLLLGVPLLVAATAAADEPAEPRLDTRLALLVKTGGLTADEAARRAVRTSADVLARRAEADAAAAGVTQSAVGFAPRVGVNFSFVRLSNITPPVLGYLAVAQGPGPISSTSSLTAIPLQFFTPLNATTLQGMVTVPISDYLLRISQSYTAARRSKRAADLQTFAQQLKVRADAKIGFYGWVRAAYSVVVAEQALAAAQGHLGDVKSSFEQGIASRADVLRVESQLAASDGLLERVRNFRAVTEEQLRTLMHEPDTAPLTIGEDLGSALPAQNLTVSPALYAEAIRARPELRALEDSELSLVEQAKVARAGMWPRVDGFGELTYANPNQRFIPPQDRFDLTWSVGVRLSWTPNDTASSYAQGKAAEARTRQLAAQRAALSDGIRNELAAAVQAVRDADTAVATSARSLIASEASYKVRRSLFQVGRATSVELTDAETDMLRARLDAVNARVDQRISRVRLQHATGRDAVAQGER